MTDRTSTKPKRRNDRHDVDPWELKLIRAGHHVWRLYRRQKPEFGQYLSETGPLWEALQTIWKAKREYRAELAAERKAKVEALVARMKARSKQCLRFAESILGTRDDTPRLQIWRPS